MDYKEIEFKKRKPYKTGNHYFYIIHSNGFVYKKSSGTIGHMKRHLDEFPTHTITWLEPENEW